MSRLPELPERYRQQIDQHMRERAQEREEEFRKAESLSPTPPRRDPIRALVTQALGQAAGLLSAVALPLVMAGSLLQKPAFADERADRTSQGEPENPEQKRSALIKEIQGIISQSKQDQQQIGSLLKLMEALNFKGSSSQEKELLKTSREGKKAIETILKRVEALRKADSIQQTQIMKEIRALSSKVKTGHQRMIGALSQITSKSKPGDLTDASKKNMSAAEQAEKKKALAQQAQKEAAEIKDNKPKSTLEQQVEKEAEALEKIAKALQAKAKALAEKRAAEAAKKKAEKEKKAAEKKKTDKEDPIEKEKKTKKDTRKDLSPEEMKRLMELAKNDPQKLKNLLKGMMGGARGGGGGGGGVNWNTFLEALKGHKNYQQVQKIFAELFGTALPSKSNYSQLRIGDDPNKIRNPETLYSIEGFPRGTYFLRAAYHRLDLDKAIPENKAYKWKEVSVYANVDPTAFISFEGRAGSNLIPAPSGHYLRQIKCQNPVKWKVLRDEQSGTTIINCEADPGQIKLGYGKGSFRNWINTEYAKYERGKVRKVIPPTLCDALDNLMSCSRETRELVIREMIKPMVYSTNAELGQLIRKKPNLIAASWKYMAGECEFLTANYTILCEYANIDKKMAVGFVDVNGDNTLSSSEGHAWITDARSRVTEVTALTQKSTFTGVDHLASPEDLKREAKQIERLSESRFIGVLKNINPIHGHNMPLAAPEEASINNSRIAPITSSSHLSAERYMHIRTAQDVDFRSGWIRFAKNHIKEQALRHQEQDPKSNTPSIQLKCQAGLNRISIPYGYEIKGINIPKKDPSAKPIQAKLLKNAGSDESVLLFESDPGVVTLYLTTSYGEKFATAATEKRALAQYIEPRIRRILDRISYQSWKKNGEETSSINKLNAIMAAFTHTQNTRLNWALRDLDAGSFAQHVQHYLAGDDATLAAIYYLYARYAGFKCSLQQGSRLSEEGSPHASTATGWWVVFDNGNAVQPSQLAQQSPLLKLGGKAKPGIQVQEQALLEQSSESKIDELIKKLGYPEAERYLSLKAGYTSRLEKLKAVSIKALKAFLIPHLRSNKLKVHDDNAAFYAETEFVFGMIKILKSKPGFLTKEEKKELEQLERQRFDEVVALKGKKCLFLPLDSYEVSSVTQMNRIARQGGKLMDRLSGASLLWLEASEKLLHYEYNIYATGKGYETKVWSRDTLGNTLPLCQLGTIEIALPQRKRQKVITVKKDHMRMLLGAEGGFSEVEFTFPSGKTLSQKESFRGRKLHILLTKNGDMVSYHQKDDKSFRVVIHISDLYNTGTQLQLESEEAPKVENLGHDKYLVVIKKNGQYLLKANFELGKHAEERSDEQPSIATDGDGHFVARMSANKRYRLIGTIPQGSLAGKTLPMIKLMQPYGNKTILAEWKNDQREYYVSALGQTAFVAGPFDKEYARTDTHPDGSIAVIGKKDGASHLYANVPLGNIPRSFRQHITRLECLGDKRLLVCEGKWKKEDREQRRMSYAYSTTAYANFDLQGFHGKVFETLWVTVYPNGKYMLHGQENKQTKSIGNIDESWLKGHHALGSATALGDDHYLVLIRGKQSQNFHIGSPPLGELSKQPASGYPKPLGHGRYTATHGTEESGAGLFHSLPERLAAGNQITSLAALDAIHDSAHKWRCLIRLVNNPPEGDDPQQIKSRALAMLDQVGDVLTSDRRIFRLIAVDWNAHYQKHRFSEKKVPPAFKELLAALSPEKKQYYLEGLMKSQTGFSHDRVNELAEDFDAAYYAGIKHSLEKIVLESPSVATELLGLELTPCYDKPKLAADLAELWTKTIGAMRLKKDPETFRYDQTYHSGSTNYAHLIRHYPELQPKKKKLDITAVFVYLESLKNAAEAPQWYAWSYEYQGADRTRMSELNKLRAIVEKSSADESYARAIRIDQAIAAFLEAKGITLSLKKASQQSISAELSRIKSGAKPAWYLWAHEYGEQASQVSSLMKLRQSPRGGLILPAHGLATTTGEQLSTTSMLSAEEAVALDKDIKAFYLRHSIPLPQRTLTPALVRQQIDATKAQLRAPQRYGDANTAAIPTWFRWSHDSDSPQKVSDLMAITCHLAGVDARSLFTVDRFAKQFYGKNPQLREEAQKTSYADLKPAITVIKQMLAVEGSFDVERSGKTGLGYALHKGLQGHQGVLQQWLPTDPQFAVFNRQLDAILGAEHQGDKPWQPQEGFMEALNNRALSLMLIALFSMLLWRFSTNPLRRRGEALLFPKNAKKTIQAVWEQNGWTQEEEAKDIQQSILELFDQIESGEAGAEDVSSRMDELFTAIQQLPPRSRGIATLSLMTPFFSEGAAVSSITSLISSDRNFAKWANILQGIRTIAKKTNKAGYSLENLQSDMTALLGKFSENEQQSPEVQSQRIHQEQVHQAFTNIKRLIGEIDASRHRDPLRGESTESKAVPLSSERGDESYERRPYSPGDSMRNMDWKAWARTDRYIVKEQDPVRSRPIALTIDVISLVHDGQAQRELAETLFALRRHHASIAGIDLILSPTQGRRIDVNRNGFGRKSARGQDTLAILHGLEKMITELVQQHEQSSVASVAEINYGIYPENQAALWQSYQAGLHRLVLSVLQARESNWSQEDIDQLLLMKLQATAQKKNSVAVIGFGNSKEALIEKLGQKRAWR